MPVREIRNLVFFGNASSQPRAKLSMRGTTKSVVGETTKFEEIYRSLTNGIPTNLIWMIFGLYMDSGVSLGVSGYLHLKMLTSFFGFIGIATTMEEIGMCAACRQMNVWLDRGIISPCCSATRTCNNCAATIPCCRGTGVAANKTCEKLVIERDALSKQKVIPASLPYVPPRTMKRSKSQGNICPKLRPAPTLAGDLLSSVILGKDVSGREIRLARPKT